MDRETSPFYLNERVEMTDKAPVEVQGQTGRITTIEHDEEMFGAQPAHYVTLEGELEPNPRPLSADQLRSAT